MCGRFFLKTTPELIESALLLDQCPEFSERYNIAPTNDILAVRRETHGRREAVFLHWGLVPGWAKDKKIGHRTINARSETASSKPAFREAFRRRRCVIPASGFYEWRKRGKEKTTIAVRPKTGKLLVFAGLWDRWIGAGGEELESCTILTTEPNAVMAKIHDRMPVILGVDATEQWLDHDIDDIEQLESLLVPCADELIETSEVSRYVNRVGNEGPRCLAPAEPETGWLFPPEG